MDIPYLAILCTALFLLSEAKVHKFDFLEPGQQPSGTGGLLYDPYIEMCCQGHVHPTASYSSSQYCCGNKTFNFRTHVCCWKSKTIKERHYGVFTVCCSDQPYDKSKAVCCTNTKKVITLPSTVAPIDAVYYRCCTNEVYDKRDHICCAGRLQQKWSVYSRCCGSEQYDRRNSVCCKDKVLSNRGLGQQALCCVDKIADSNTQLCCNFTKIVNIERGLTACCGNRGYNKILELCCDDKILARKWYSQNHKCCGKSTYDSTKELCCEGNVEKKRSFRSVCCGTKIIELDIQMCCDLKMNKRPNMFTRCCGTETYDSRREVCCGNQVLKKGKDTRDHCCAKDIRSHLHRSIECRVKGDDLEPDDEQW